MALRTWITSNQLEYHLGPALMRRLYDEDDDGTPDTNPVTQLRQSASSYVAGYLRGIYSLTAIDTAQASGAPTDMNEITRLTLDAAEWMACKRYPEVALNKNWQDLREANEKELKALRKGDMRLDIEGTPEPAANAGGESYEGDPDDYNVSTWEPMFIWGTGDF